MDVVTTDSETKIVVPDDLPVKKPEGDLMQTDRHFLTWLRKTKSSFMISCYKSQSVIHIGVTQNKNENRDVHALYISDFLRPMGLHATPDGKSIWIGTANVLWKYVADGSRETDNEIFNNYDECYIPRSLHVINDIDCHDITQDATGQVYFVSALFGCICTPSETHSFKVFWKPPWVSKVAAEDRCHLNGMSARDGEIRYVTAVAQTNIRSGWRDKRTNGGVVYDIKEDRVVCSGLSMPHSPRWYKDRLWVLNSGTGYMGYVNLDAPDPSEAFVSCLFIPGYMRGLSFIGGKYALIASSLDRHEKIFQDIPLGENLKKFGVEAKCGVHIVDIESMDVIHDLIFGQDREKPVTEIYDVIALPGAQRSRIENINNSDLLTSYRVDQSDDQPST